MTGLAELQLGGGRRRARRQADAVAIAEQELLDPPAAPPQPIGGVEIADKPCIAYLLQQGVLHAHARSVDPDFGVRITAQPVGTWAERQPLFPAAAAPPAQFGRAAAHGVRRGTRSISRHSTARLMAVSARLNTGK